jgi:hypothetical protein
MCAPELSRSLRPWSCNLVIVDCSLLMQIRHCSTPMGKHLEIQPLSKCGVYCKQAHLVASTHSEAPWLASWNLSSPCANRVVEERPALVLNVRYLIDHQVLESKRYYYSVLRTDCPPCSLLLAIRLEGLLDGHNQLMYNFSADAPLLVVDGSQDLRGRPLLDVEPVPRKLPVVVVEGVADVGELVITAAGPVGTWLCDHGVVVVELAVHCGTVRRPLDELLRGPGRKPNVEESILIRLLGRAALI